MKACYWDKTNATIAYSEERFYNVRVFISKRIVYRVYEYPEEFR